MSTEPQPLLTQEQRDDNFAFAIQGMASQGEVTEIGHVLVRVWNRAIIAEAAARAVPALDAIKALRPKDRIYVEEDDYVSGFGDAKDAAIRALSDARAVPALDALRERIAALPREESGRVVGEAPYTSWQRFDTVALDDVLAALSDQQSKGET